jgi:transposase
LVDEENVRAFERGTQLQSAGFALPFFPRRKRLDFEPGRFFRRLLVRPKYVLIEDKEAAPIIAPLPSCLQERCIAAPGLLATVAVSKYCDHLPLYRQEMIFKTRHGMALPRSTLTRWLALIAFWLQPIYEIIRTTVMDNKYVQIDERRRWAAAT